MAVRAPFALEKASLEILRSALDRLEAGFRDLPPDPTPPPGADRIEGVLAEVAERLHDNYPYFHPLYAGQMLKPPHPVARLAYALAHVDQPEQPRARRRARELRDGEGGGRRDRARCSAGRRTSATSAAAGRWRTSRRSGWPGGCSPAERSWPPRRRTTRTGGSAPCSACRSRRSRATAAGGWTSGALGRRLAARRRRHRRRDAGNDGDGLGGSAPGDPRAARAPRLPAARRRRVRRLLRPRGQPRARARARRSTGSARPTRSSSIRTSTGCSRTAAAACSSATRRSAASTSTTRPTRTSARRSSTWARSASSARGRERPRWRSGRRSGFLPLERGGRIRARALDCRARRGARAARRSAPGTPGSRAGFEPELDIVVWLARAPSARGRPRHGPRRIFDEAARRGLHLALAELPGAFFGPRGPERGGRSPCLRSVLMKPEHRDVGRIGSGRCSATRRTRSGVLRESFWMSSRGEAADHQRQTPGQ